VVGTPAPPPRHVCDVAPMTACACGKVRYPTRRHARRAARMVSGRTGRMRAYRCDGGFWHLTSQTGARLTSWRAYDRRTDGL
jgi:hypothetical protein